MKQSSKETIYFFTNVSAGSLTLSSLTQPKLTVKLVTFKHSTTTTVKIVQDRKFEKKKKKKEKNKQSEQLNEN